MLPTADLHSHRGLRCPCLDGCGGVLSCGCAAVRVAIRASAANQRTVARGRLRLRPVRRRFVGQQRACGCTAGQTCRTRCAARPLAAAPQSRRCVRSERNGWLRRHADLQMSGRLELLPRSVLPSQELRRSVASATAAGKTTMAVASACGAAVARAPACAWHSAAPAGNSCADTLDKVRACTANTPPKCSIRRGLGLRLSFSAGPVACQLRLCSKLELVSRGVQLDAQGLHSARCGHALLFDHGRKLNSCGALYFRCNNRTAFPAGTTCWQPAATVISGQRAGCFTLPSSTTTDSLHYNTIGGAGGFPRQPLRGGPTGCTPISSSMLLPALP